MPTPALDPPLQAELEQCIAQYTGHPAIINRLSGVGGGCISQAVLVHTSDAAWFVKLNDADHLPALAAEADGLAALMACRHIRVPQVVGIGRIDNHAFLILEHLKLSPLSAGANRVPIAGLALAHLHRITNARPGWHQNNFIGNTPQHNTWQTNWPEFFGQQRLLPQLRFARDNGFGGSLLGAGEQLLAQLPQLLAGHQPNFSLLHGDLWQGNAALDENGKLALYDPATYFGDRETDLAMSELFGGFPAKFYTAYRETWPLDDGYPLRKTLYQLYHVLNHLNLFGGDYLHQARQLIDFLLASVKR